jgi:hypothetical protein
MLNFEVNQGFSEKELVISHVFKLVIDNYKCLWHLTLDIINLSKVGWNLQNFICIEKKEKRILKGNKSYEKRVQICVH